ncbi:MAG TPA: hypothetical protein VMF06_14825, partial [Candidatus Limnocylindria bacterium]|nr:hypothetical protein [Candidatus Limnocylindria bacterium]
MHRVTHIVLRLAIFLCAIVRLTAQDGAPTFSTNLTTVLSTASAGSLSVIGWGAVDTGPYQSIDFGQVVLGDFRGFYASTNAPDWGTNSPGNVPDLLETASTVALACGEYHTLLLKRDGSLVARGW